MAKPGFRERYAVEVPVVLAGMALVAEPGLVAAVTEAGGLGVLGTGPLPPPLVCERIAAVRARTRGTFGVNQIVATTPLGPFTTTAGIGALVEERVPFVVFHWDAPEIGRAHV